MFGRVTLSRFGAAADAVANLDRVAQDLAPGSLLRDAQTELVTIREEVEDAAYDVKTAAQSATIAFVLVSVVAVAALALATFAIVNARAGFADE